MGQEAAGGEAPGAHRLLPLLSGEVLLKIPGETYLPGWRVTASIMPPGEYQSSCQSRLAGTGQSRGLCANHTATRPPLRLPRHPDFIGTPRNDNEGCYPDLEPPSDCRSERSEEGCLDQGAPSHYTGNRRAGCQRNSVSACLDLARTGTELSVRQRQPGDRFQPLGMSTTKKLQDFMVDARIPRAWRQHIPLVCCPQHILWVVGWRIDDRVKVTEASRELLRLEFARWG